MNSKRKILVYSTQFMPTGGIESHLQEFCNRMAENNIAIDLVIPNSQMKPETRQSLEACCNNIYLVQSNSPFIRTLFLLFSSFRMLFNRYSALYTNGQGESVRLFARLFRFQNWVHHHHTAGDVDDQATWGKRYHQVLQDANTVIACSQRNAGMMELALNREILVIPAFSRKVKSQRDSFFHTPFRFGYYGRLIPEKGIDILCRLSMESALQDCEFHIWGEGTAYPASFFKRYPKVHYHGTFTGVQDLEKVLSCIDVYLLLSVHPEGLPISLLEVMGAGIPWLATDKGGIPDIAVDPASTRVISAASSYEQIYNAILDFARDVRDEKVSGTAQQQLYDANFSADALVIRWKRVLELS